jgi:poly(3-hydroxybutyrate) depolymerase
MFPKFLCFILGLDMCRLLTKPLPAGQVAGGTYNMSITSSGIPRWYLISIPPFYEEEQLSPVILSYHSGLENATQQMNLTQMSNPYFNNISFVIYPQGINVCTSMKRKYLTDIPGLMARNSRRQLQRHQIHKRYPRPD